MQSPSPFIHGTVRKPAVSGMFYPTDPETLRPMTRDFLRQARIPPGLNPKAVIAPHAGYVYSGAIAASAFASWFPEKTTIRRIILLGPAHRCFVEGLAVGLADTYETPLGSVPVDREAIQRLRSFPQVEVNDEAHSTEHSLEVELPFLQETLDEFTLVPLVVGEARDEAISDVINALWGGPETRIVVSSDLSHYLEYATARERDQKTARAIEALQPDAIESEQACGCRPVRGLLRAAAQHQLRVRTLDLRNSGDTAGPRHRVVGYGAFAFL
jgi:MEMO1 family protein